MLVNRKKGGMIISGGFNVFSTDIEAGGFVPNGPAPPHSYDDFAATRGRGVAAALRLAYIRHSGMELSGLDHYTLRATPAALPALREFYTRVLPLREGARPAFDFPGHWLYIGTQAVVHLAGTLPEGPHAQALGGIEGTGALDHISLRCRGLQATRERLRALGVPSREAPVPGGRLHQIFLRDPVGLTIELTFDAHEQAAQPAV